MQLHRYSWVGRSVSTPFHARYWGYAGACQWAADWWRPVKPGSFRCRWLSALCTAVLLAGILPRWTSAQDPIIAPQEPKPAAQPEVVPGDEVRPHRVKYRARD